MATAIAGAIIGGLGGAAVVGVVGSALIHIGVGVAFSAVSAALMKQDTGATKVPGIRSQVTTEGDTSPQTFIVGYYATPGNLVCPHMSFARNQTSLLDALFSGFMSNPLSGGVFGNIGGLFDSLETVGDVEYVAGSGNYRTQVRDLGDMPINGLSQIIIEGVTFDWVNDFDHDAAGFLGSPLASESEELLPYNGYLWARFYDGNQDYADPTLVSIYGDHPERPWSVDMVGVGVPYECKICC